MTQPQLNVREIAEEKFNKGFSFEGNNDPNDSPKMLFVKHHDGTKSIAKPEYVLAFIDQIITLAQEEKIKEVENMKKYWHLHFEGVGDEIERKKRKQFNEEASVYINSVIDDVIKILKQ